MFFSPVYNQLNTIACLEKGLLSTAKVSRPTYALTTGKPVCTHVYNLFCSGFYKHVLIVVKQQYASLIFVFSKHVSVA